MRIKLVHFTSSLKIGGAETVLSSLVEHLARQNFEQTVVYIHDGPYKETIQKVGIPCYQISGYFFRYDIFFFIRLYRLLKRLKPDGLHTLLWAANCSGRVMGRMLGIPVVSAMHNNSEQDGLVRNLFDRLTLPAATKIVAVSDEVAAGLPRRYQGCSALVIIKNGVDFQQIGVRSIQLRKERALFGFAPDAMVIGAVGRFEPVKRYDLLLDTFAQLAEQVSRARLLLIGSGSQEFFLREHAARLGLLGMDQKVHFVRDYPAYGYYSLMDIFVQTSDKEGISLALLEAMSLGVACVVTHAGIKHPVIMHEKDGLVVRAGDARSLVKTLAWVAKDQQLRNELGVSARKKVQQEFSQGGMHEAYTHLFVDMTVRRAKI